jgi:predicted Zn-dependent protease
VSSEELELAERCLGHAGDCEAEVTVTRERSLTCRFARSEATQATAVENVDVEMLCVVNGHTAAASTNDTTAEGLRDVASRARRAAEATARLAQKAGSYPGLPAPDAEPPSPHRGFDAETAALDAAVAHRALAEVFAVAAESRLRAFGIWTAGEVRVALASSTGVRGVDAITDAHMRVICRDDDGRSGFAADSATGAAALDAPGLARRAAAKVDGRPLIELPPGEYPVVLAAEAVGELLSFLGALAFNGLAHAEERGALVGRLGTQVAAAQINLSDSPRHPHTLPRAFDAEGVPKRPLPLLQDGVARAVVHDTRSAARAGGDARSTGHALIAGGDPYGPVPTNLVLAGGGAGDEAALAAPIDRGIYVTRFWYVNAVHPQRTLLTGMTRDGTFLIDGGELAEPVRDVRFTDEALRILAATEDLGARADLVSEAGLYGRRFANGMVCPALRAQGFRVTGATVD